MRVLILALLLISFNTLSKISIIEKTIEYKVTSNSKDTLLSELNLSTPISMSGKPFHGLTNNSIKWTISWKSFHNRCRVFKVTTNLTTTYTMPKLETESAEVQAVWDDWYPYLLLHEKGHAKLGKLYANKVYRGLKDIKPNKDCEKLTEIAESLVKDLIEQLSDANDEYDRATNHGETENAWIYQHL
ncbi:DUF922 domain-containing Zn-dependent protease [Shewanella phaeophyticola]|uniref:DUF922 domain-containing Zn-dependent protease n=1 Tax=Shewanella phaeophyticola TaxID=2978345 RepID=A0ABT2P1P6_9GAMM|nr:DUF922 domain-containing Zn-dependent protease [Shewanella sp. KJ10-1]MCT8986574.1 DUF922 domain-containing Zn-dependent protease [Shewanella sp. KJ10-1]